MKRTWYQRMLKIGAVALLLLGAWMLNTVIAASNRICVCHVENKETGKGHVIRVDKDSLSGHLKHGDVQCTVDCDTVLNKRCNISTGGACND